MLKELRPALASFAVLTVITGILYPLAITGIAQATMPEQANGSLIVKEGKTIGSALVGQPFSDPKYFWSRPSATGPTPYNSAASSGSNLGPTNPALLDGVKARVRALRDADPGNTAPVPVDLVTASASGLDPHISPAAAEYQAARVARVRGIPPAVVRRLIAKHTAGRQFGFLGEPVVNVLQLNLALDAVARQAGGERPPLRVGAATIDRPRPVASRLRITPAQCPPASPAATEAVPLRAPARRSRSPAPRH